MSRVIFCEALKGQTCQLANCRAPLHTTQECETLLDSRSAQNHRGKLSRSDWGWSVSYFMSFPNHTGQSIRQIRHRDSQMHGSQGFFSSIGTRNFPFTLLLETGYQLYCVPLKRYVEILTHISQNVTLFINKVVTLVFS